jgi:predicted nuclease of predicted toxin-antitoxin system
MKIIIDMNLSPGWVVTLSNAGLDAAHWSTLGPPATLDAEIMAYAREHDAVVLTHDLDFGAILAASGAEKPSVIQVRAEDVSPDRIGPQEVAAILQMSAELQAGALVTVEPLRNRLSVLPLQRR